MTRLLTCGFELGDVAELGTTTVGTGTITAVTSTPTPRGGSYCMKIASASSFNAIYKAFNLGASKTDVWLRLACYFHGVTGTSDGDIIQWLDSASAQQNCLTFNASDGLLRARVGGVAGTVLATSSAAMTQDAWHLLEMRVQLTSTTVGIIEVWLDGTRVINFSGDNSNTANVNVASFQLGAVNNWSGAWSSGAYLAFDDIGVNDTAGTRNNGQIGDGRIVLLVPTGAGSNTGMTRGGTDSGANWSQVEELPPSMTDYVFHATAATRDTYALSDLPTGATSVNVAEVIVLAQNSDAGAGSLGLTVKSGATTNEGTAQALGTSALYYRQQYETDPATSSAWTASGLNALEAGVTVR